MRGDFEASVIIDGSWVVQAVSTHHLVHLRDQFLALFDLVVFPSQLELLISHWLLDLLSKCLHGYLVGRILLQSVTADVLVGVHDLRLVDSAKDWIICQPRDLQVVDALRMHELGHLPDDLFHFKLRIAVHHHGLQLTALISSATLLLQRYLLPHSQSPFKRLLALNDLHRFLRLISLQLLDSLDEGPSSLLDLIVADDRR